MNKEVVKADIQVKGISTTEYYSPTTFTSTHDVIIPIEHAGFFGVIVPSFKTKKEKKSCYLRIKDSRSVHIGDFTDSIPLSVILESIKKEYIAIGRSSMTNEFKNLLNIRT